MVKIAQHIEKLLYCHDCVVIPELGGFIANYSGAQIDVSRKIILPPTKSILFNKNITVNDGLLASSIAADENISFEVANENLQSFTKDCKSKLSANGRVELQNIGVLSLDDEKNIQFNQSKTNFLTASFGLPIVDFIPAEKKVSLVKENAQPTLLKVEPVTTKETKVISITSVPKEIVEEKNRPEEKKKRGLAFYAAAAIIPVFFIYSGLATYNSGVIYSGEFQTAALNPINWFSQKQNYNPRLFVEITEDLHADVKTDVFVTPVEEINNEDIIEIAPKVETTHVEISLEEDLTIKYHLIGGCFSKKRNAKNYIKNLSKEGFDAKIIGKHKGLYRVSIGGATSRKTIKQIRKESDDLGFTTWILKL